MNYTDRELRRLMGEMLMELEGTAVKEKTAVDIFNFRRMREVFEEKYNCDWEEERKKHKQEQQR